MNSVKQKAKDNKESVLRAIMNAHRITSLVMLTHLTGLSNMTVRKYLLELQEDGVIEYVPGTKIQPGRGTPVRKAVIRLVAK